MKNTIQSVFFTIVLIVIVFLSGCIPVSTPLPPASTSLLPTEQPSETASASSPMVGNANYDGKWEGSPVKFTVLGNKVASELYLLKDCGIASTPGSEADINGNKFVVNTSPQTNVQVTISGQFDSDTTASGTISATGGGCEMTTTWTATRK